MSQSDFQDRLARLGDTAELRDLAPQGEAPPLTPANDQRKSAREDGDASILTIALVILTGGLSGLFFFDKAMAIQVAFVAVPVIAVLGAIQLKRAVRRNASDVFDTGIDLFDIAKSLSKMIR